MLPWKPLPVKPNWLFARTVILLSRYGISVGQIMDHCCGRYRRAVRQAR